MTVMIGAIIVELKDYIIDLGRKVILFYVLNLT